MSGSVHPAVYRRRREREAGGGGAVVAFKYTPGDSLASWTTSRASTATYYDTNGVVQTATSGTMRDGHFLGGVRHWLLEPARTNSTLQSQDLTNAVWTKSLCTIGGSITTPDGTAAVTTVGIIGTNATNTLVDGTLNVVTATGYTVTASTNQAYGVFAAPGNKSNLIIQSKDNAGAFHTSWVNVTTGAVGTKDASHVIKTWPLSSTFYRVEVRLTTSGAGAGANLFAFGFVDADNSHTLTGDGATVNGYVWGAQYEIDQPWLTSYIATTTVAVARVADAATRPHSSTPQIRTLYADTTYIGPALQINIGGAVTNFQNVQTDNTPQMRATITNNATQSQATVGGGFVVGDHLELRSMGFADGSGTVTGGQSINGGGETSGNGSAGGAYQAGYAQPTYSIAVTPIALRGFKDILGAQSLAACRSA